MISQFKREPLHQVMKRMRWSIFGEKKEREGVRNSERQHTVMRWVFVLWLMMLIPLSVSSQASNCEDFPFVSRGEWESYPKWEGYYFNCSNGYAITIPKGFIGRSTPPPAPHHGFGIWLSSDPDGYVWVNGSAASPEGDFPLEEEADKRVEWIEKDAQKMLSVQRSHSMLDSLPAIRLVVRYVRPNDVIKIEDYVLALDQRGFEYTIALSADEATYEEYKPILEQLAGTFRLIDNSCPSACEILWPDDESSLATFEGEYVSCRFGYALTIPTGFVGHITSSLADSGLGFDILLSQQPRGIIKVDLSSNEPGWHSPDEVAEEELAWIEWSTRQILSVQQEPLTLAGLPAVRCIVRYVCSDGTLVVKDTFFVLHQERELVYKMWLLSDDATYEEYTPILEQLVKTFQLRDPSCE